MTTIPTVPTTISERVPVPLPGGMPAIGAKSLTPADVLGMVRRRIVTIFLLSILFGAAAVGLFFLLYSKYPKYAASAYVECISPDPPRGMSFEEQQLQKDAFERFIKSQALFIKSPPILSDVLQDPEVRGTSWYQGIEAGKHMLELEGILGCSDIRDTNYIRVAIATRNIGDPHIIVNKVVEVYLGQVRDQKSAPFRQELRDYTREVAQLREQILEKQKQIREFQSTIPPGNLPGDAGAGGGAILTKMKTDQEAVAELERQTAQLDALRQVYADPTGPAVTQEDRLMVEQDPRVASLENQVRALEQEMNIHLVGFGENHREYREMATRRAEAARQLEIERANRLREILEQKKEQVETAFNGSQSALLQAKNSLQETEAQLADIEAKLSEYQRLMDDRDMLVEIQKQMDNYIRDVERVVRESSAVRVQAAVRATKPLQRSFPTLIMLPALVVAALGAAFGLAIGLELIDTSVKTPQDIVRHLNLAILGSIPDVDDEEVNIERVESAVRDAPQSMVTEAFRTLRSNLQFSAPLERMRTILVTSPKPEDGRTTVAANLAASLAVAGRRVLLVDANFRRPAIHKLYDNVGRRGMTNILVNEARTDECVHKTDLANLDVIGSGPVPPNPAELLGSPQFRAFLTEVTDKYDHVVIDSPPVLLASDATVLATIVDGTILVLRAKDNSRGVALRASSLLARAGAHLFGAVLNAAQARRGGYFREQQRTFYVYQSDEEGADETRRALPQREAPEEPRADDEE